MNKKHYIGKKNINIFLIETVMGVILIAIVAVFAIRTDIISAQKNLSYTAGHINDQCNSVTRINLAAETKSLMRVIGSAQQIKQNIVYEKRIKENTDYIFSPEFLKKNTEECYLSAVILLDNNGKPVAQYYKDDMETVELDEYMESSSLLDVADNALKSFATRIDLEDGSYVDMAAKGMADGTGIVITCYHTSTEYADDYNLSFDHILSGYYDSEGGTVVVTSGDKIISSSNEDMIGNSVDDYIILKKIKDSDESGKLMHAQSSKSPYNHDFGLMKRGRDYYVYIYLPERAIFDNTISHIIYTFAIYMYIIVIYNMLRWKTAQIYEKNQSELSQQYASELAKKNEQLKEAISREEQANAAKSDFLSRMSHDIRTPMNAIIGMTTIARMNLGDMEKVSDCLKKIDMSSAHLLGLLNEVLDMSKIEAGNFELGSEQFDIVKLTQDLIEMSRAVIDEKHHKLTLNIGELKHTTVEGDSQRIRQVFVNLLGNAVKYTPPYGNITISLNEKSPRTPRLGCYEFIFEDNGIGMTQEYMKYIFDPFSRAEDTRINSIEGTGLGLSIAKNIVSMMDGTIQVESEVNKGSKFTVTIFLKLPDTIYQQEKINRTENGYNTLYESSYNIYSGKNILLVEDNKRNAEVASELIGITGVNVELAENGRVAVERFMAHEPGYYGLIFMDIQLPVMNGYDAARCIRMLDREDTKSIPIIAMTANAFTEDVEAAYSAGMNEHIAKPLEFGRLTEVLKKWLG